MPHSAASDLGLHCLPVTLLWVSRLKWINIMMADGTRVFRPMTKLLKMNGYAPKVLPLFCKGVQLIETKRYLPNI